MAKHNFDPLSNIIIGAAIQVHRELGPAVEFCKINLRGKTSSKLNFVFSNFRAFVINRYKGKKSGKNI